MMREPQPLPKQNKLTQIQDKNGADRTGVTSKECRRNEGKVKYEKVCVQEKTKQKAGREGIL